MIFSENVVFEAQFNFFMEKSWSILEVFNFLYFKPLQNRDIIVSISTGVEYIIRYIFWS